MTDLSALDPQTCALLEAYGFDQIPFADLVQRLKSGEIAARASQLAGTLAPPAAAALNRLPARAEAEAKRLHDLGQQALDAGQVGVVVLNGGMATRFGGQAKGTLPVLKERSFLDFKLSQIAGGAVPVLLMNSFATHEETGDHLGELALDHAPRSFSQLVSLRLTDKGELFLDSNGRPSPYAPGHGDLAQALAARSELERLRQAGCRWLFVSNVDNLGASLDPLIIGLHIDQGQPMSVEVVESDPTDSGGFAVRVNGRMTIVESFCFPPGTDLRTRRFLNTNTFVFDINTLIDSPQLKWFPVVKNVDQRRAIQFERLLGQLADHHEVSWVIVPREGEQSRFIPIKTPADLETRAELLRSVLVARGVLGSR